MERGSVEEIQADYQRKGRYIRRSDQEKNMEEFEITAKISKIPIIVLELNVSSTFSINAIN